MNTNIALFSVILILSHASSAYSQVTASADLSEASVLNNFKNDLTNLQSQEYLSSASRVSVEIALDNLVEVSYVSQMHGIKFSQSTIANFRSLDGVVTFVSQQGSINHGLSDAEAASLQAVAADLTIKWQSCEADFPDTGLTDMRVSVVTPDPKVPGKYIDGCQVFCVEAGWYGLPGEKDMTYMFPLPSSPSVDTMTPGLYYWWTVRNGVALKPALKMDVDIKPNRSNDLTLSVPAPSVVR